MNLFSFVPFLLDYIIIIFWCLWSCVGFTSSKHFNKDSINLFNHKPRSCIKCRSSMYWKFLRKTFPFQLHFVTILMQIRFKIIPYNVAESCKNYAKYFHFIVLLMFEIRGWIENSNENCANDFVIIERF